MPKKEIIKFWPVHFFSMLMKNEYAIFLSIKSAFKMNTTPEVAANVVMLLENGMSLRHVARELNVSKSTAGYLYKRYLETHSLHRRPGSGSVRKTTAQDDRFIGLQSLRNRQMTATAINVELQRARGTEICDRTVRRRLKELNLTPKRPATGPKLTTRQKTKSTTLCT